MVDHHEGTSDARRMFWRIVHFNFAAEPHEQSKI